MRSVDAHLRQVLATVTPLRELELRLADAHGCVLAEDVDAAGAVPAYDTVAAAGYAVRSADVAAAAAQAPVGLHVVGDVPVGVAPAVTVQPGLAARVALGAVLPRGADAVVPAAWTDGGLAQVAVSRPVPPGAFVRAAGTDVAAGARVLSRDAVIGAPQVALLAAAGRRNVLVRPKPRVVVVSVGAELVEPGRDLAPGEVADAAGYGVAAAVREAGAIAFPAGIVPDDARRVADVVEDHLIQADLVVVCGGLGGGPYDVVSDVLGRLGSATFDEVAMHPGGVQGFAIVGDEAVPVFALPGEPGAALVAFEVFVRPALRRMLGAETLGRPHVSAVATTAFASPEGRRQFVRARVERSADRWVVTPTGETLTGLGAANALAVVPEDVTEVAAGTPLLTWLLERRGV
ncbi:MAG TPA: gephyrin-like molybdotransferase Glp [Mycobacteriales bacterium]|nr:gephyrin-like molybdotransferase Glp [Mycobacteriales bacterium]